jgi:imidazolonepropionase-like amidohydrolase
MRKLLAVLSCTALFLTLSVAEVQAQTQATPPASSGATVVETGHFQLHKFEQLIGQESYVMTRDGNAVSVKVDLKFTDRGTAAPLTATFRGSADLTPTAFEIKGQTARWVAIDKAVEIQPGKVRVRDREQWSERSAPTQFFTIAGYSPTTMQMLMVRYWATHGSPAELGTLPSGTVRIEPRGEDNFTVGSELRKLTRYTVEGLIWGRETLWFDDKSNLVAAITTDAEFDHFEAIRDEYESALGDFVARAGKDNMAALAQLSKGISGSRAKTLALVGATLIDGTGAALSDSAVVIEDGKIIAAGPRAKVKVPDNATVIDESGKTILPGLWDMHAHFEQVEWGPIYLAAGVTTVRDCANEFEFIRTVRDAVAEGRGLGPRLLLAGVVDGSGNWQVGVQRVDTPAQAKMWTDKYHDAGFQQVKIYSSIKLEQLKAVTEEAHRLGMSVTGHVPEGITTYEAIEAGQDQINHVQYIAQMMYKPLPAGADRAQRYKAIAGINLNSAEAHKALAFLKEHHTVVDPTLALMELFGGSTAKPPASFEPGVKTLPEELAAQLAEVGPPGPYADLQEKVLQRYIEIVGALHKNGIPVVAGTDQAVPGHSLHRELELYVQAGFSPMEALQAATIVPARVMGMDKEVGTIEAGKRADLVVIHGNPLEDIRNSRNVEYVVTNGTMYNAGELWKSVGFKP